MCFLCNVSNSTHCLDDGYVGTPVVDWLEYFTNSRWGKKIQEIWIVCTVCCEITGMILKTA